MNGERQKYFYLSLLYDVYFFWYRVTTYLPQISIIIVYLHIKSTVDPGGSPDQLEPDVDLRSLDFVSFGRRSKFSEDVKTG